MKNLLTQNQAINFDKLNKAIPNLKPEFTQGASGVYPIFSVILKYVYVIAGLILLFSLISGGFQMMTSANDEKKVAEARARITNALTGFLILFVAYWIVQIIEYIFGISIF